MSYFLMRLVSTSSALYGSSDIFSRNRSRLTQAANGVSVRRFKMQRMNLTSAHFSHHSVRLLFVYVMILIQKSVICRIQQNMRLDRLPIREVALLLMGNKNAARENLAALSTDYFKVFFIISAVLNRNMPDIVFLILPNNTRKTFAFNIKPITR